MFGIGGVAFRITRINIGFTIDTTRRFEDLGFINLKVGDNPIDIEREQPGLGKILIHGIAERGIQVEIGIAAVLVIFNGLIRCLGSTIHAEFFLFALFHTGNRGHIDPAEFQQGFKPEEPIILAGKSHKLGARQRQRHISGFDLLYYIIFLSSINDLEGVFPIEVAFAVLIDQNTDPVADFTFNAELLFLINDKSRGLSLTETGPHLATLLVLEPSIDIDIAGNPQGNALTSDVSADQFQFFGRFRFGFFADCQYLIDELLAQIEILPYFKVPVHRKSTGRQYIYSQQLIGEKEITTGIIQLADWLNAGKFDPDDMPVEFDVVGRH